MSSDLLSLITSQLHRRSLNQVQLYQVPLTRALVELVEEIVLLLEALHQPVPHTLLPIAPVNVLDRQTPATQTYRSEPNGSQTR